MAPSGSTGPFLLCFEICRFSGYSGGVSLFFMSTKLTYSFPVLNKSEPNLKLWFVGIFVAHLQLSEHGRLDKQRSSSILTPTTALYFQDNEDCRDVARGLVGRSLLQAVGNSGYRVHDLLLNFVRDRIKPAPLEKAVSRQAQYLARYDVVVSGDFHEGYSSLVALWRPVDELSSNPRIQVEATNTSVEQLKDAEASVFYCLFVGRLLERQVSTGRAKVVRLLAGQDVLGTRVVGISPADSRVSVPTFCC